MSTGRHAAQDGSFVRSTGSAALRGGILIGIAVIIGLILLGQGLDNDAPTVSATDTTAASGEDTSTSATTGAAGAGGSTTSTTGPVKPVNEVKALVANGSGVKGAAGNMSEQLKQAGYVVLPETNSNERVQTTTIYFAEGFQREAVRLAETVGTNAQAAQALPAPAPVADTAGTNLLVVLGPDLAKPGE
jgi:hypothetical protein